MTSVYVTVALCWLGSLFFVQVLGISRERRRCLTIIRYHSTTKKIPSQSVGPIELDVSLGWDPALYPKADRK